MATQSYIIGREEIIIRALEDARSGRPVDVQATRDALRESSEAYAHEQRCGGNRANRDCWGTLRVNVQVLGHFCPELRQECKQLAREMMGF